MASLLPTRILALLYAPALLLLYVANSGLLSRAGCVVHGVCQLLGAPISFSVSVPQIGDVLLAGVLHDEPPDRWFSVARRAAGDGRRVAPPPWFGKAATRGGPKRGGWALALSPAGRTMSEAGLVRLAMQYGWQPPPARKRKR